MKAALSWFCLGAYHKRISSIIYLNLEIWNWQWQSSTQCIMRSETSMTIKVILFALIFCSAVFPQATGRCRFLLSSSDYRCELIFSTVTSETVNVELFGDHVLSLTDNDVTTFSVDHLTSRVNVIPWKIFDTFPNLETITAGPDLVDVRFDVCGKHLKEIKLHNNLELKALRNGSFQGCQHVEMLMIQEASMVRSLSLIEESVFSGMPNLKAVYLQQNGLTKVHGNWFNNNLMLDQLYLGYNQIISIHPSAFQGLKNLRIVHIENNFLVRISYGTFANIPSLEMLNLNSNQIQTIESGVFGHVPNLWYIDLSHNSITFLDSFTFITPMVGLNQLNLNFNQITSIGRNFLVPFTTIHTIALGNNICINQSFTQIASVEIDVLPALDACFNNFLS